MLSLLAVCLIACVAAGVLIWLLSFINFDPKITSLIRGLIILFAVIFVVVTLWNGRAAFGLH